MPCYEGPRPEELLERKMPAVLCALATALGGQHPIWDAIDWKEAGVTPAEFEQWWENHQKQDAQRRSR